MSNVMTTTYYPTEIDIAPFKSSATAETTGYPILVTVELWPMTAGGGSHGGNHPRDTHRLHDHGHHNPSG